MPIDLTEVYGDLDTIDVEARRVAPLEALRHVLESAVQPRRTPPVPVAGGLGDEFVEEFTARRIAFLDDSGPVPLRMVLVPELNENPLPIPAHATFTSATEIDTPTPVAAERSPVTVRKVFGAPTTQTSIACGLLTEGENRSTRAFVAVGESGTTAYWIDIQGEFTRPDGSLHTASFAGDGGIPPEALSASEFSAQLDGSVFRLHGEEERTRVSEAGFGSLTRLRFARTPEGETTVTAEGELRAAESVIPARVPRGHGHRVGPDDLHRRGTGRACRIQGARRPRRATGRRGRRGALRSLELGGAAQVPARWSAERPDLGRQVPLAGALAIR
jgi:hypothetical protein